jgi:hypothetical protein
MITIQEAHQYKRLVDVGVADGVKCPIDKDHTDLVIGINDNDLIYFWCLACGTKVNPGFELIEKIKNVLKDFNSLQ